MAKRYELSDACWEMIEDLITQDQKPDAQEATTD